MNAMPFRGKRLSGSRKAASRVRQKTARAARATLSRSQAVAKTAQKALRLAKTNRTKLYGSKQLNLQETEHTVVVKKTEPHCLQIMCPITGTGGGIWKSSDEPVVGRTSTIATSFKYPTPKDDGKYDQWKSCNGDAINGQYKLLWQKYRFKFECPSNRQARFRIDFIRPYRAIRSSSADDCLLPDALGDMQSLVGQQMLNPFKWKHVRKSMFINVNPENELTGEEVYRTVFLPSGIVYNPTYEASNRPDLDIPLSKQIWMVISSDTEDGTSNPPGMTIQRVVAWRDHHGHAA